MIAKAHKPVLVLGAYGLIGFGITQRLLAAGHDVVGLGRDVATAARVLPDMPCTIADVATLRTPEDWFPILEGISVVVNCTGALQDGPEDSLEDIHHHAIAALANACAPRDIQLIQISAVGASIDATSPFLASKGRGDAAIMASSAHYQIFRPGLVLAPHAYGGTAMLRMLAAIPLIQPVAMGNARLQTTALADISTAICAAIEGHIPAGFAADFVEDTPHTLRDIITQLRHWLGFKRAICNVAVPNPILKATSKIADVVSQLGWRSPLRTTSITVLSAGVTGNPSAWNNLSLFPLSTLPQTLAAMPATTEDRLFARISLVMPLLVATLSLFWLLSGVIALMSANTAALVLENVGWSHGLALMSVIFWAIIDIALAGAILLRKTAKTACWAMIGVSCFYLLSSSIFAPHLWADPLGPLVKIIPSIMLTLVTRIALETR